MSNETNNTCSMERENEVADIKTYEDDLSETGRQQTMDASPAGEVLWNDSKDELD